MHRRSFLRIAALGGAMPLAATAASFRDLLDAASSASPLAAKGLLCGLARAGKRLVAVGQRGHILTSDDAGRTWQQAAVPVSSDLLAVHFPTADAGWAVGHDGVVLNSTDAGRTWQRQLDGRALGDVLTAAYAQGGDAKWYAEAKRFAAQGAENPLLDVCFQDAKNGHVVGAFGLVLRTADGGKTWTPLLHLADNPKALHLYAVRRIGDGLYVAGEQGTLLKWDGSRFAALASPYAGTLFGLVGNDRVVLAHGLRGNVVRSTDGGRSWTAVPTGVPVGLTASAVDASGRIVIVSHAGHVLVSGDDGATFAPRKLARAVPAAAVIGGDAGTLVVAGPRGVQVLASA
jgi:photosystem II stability/assembly factor-like uncharacterized protein